MIQLLEEDPQQNDHAIEALCRFALEAEEKADDTDLPVIQKLPSRIIQAFGEVVQASQLVMGFLEHAPGRWGISYRINSAILAQDTEALDPEDVPSNRVLAWARTLQRIKHWARYASSYVVEAANDDDVAERYGAICEKIQKCKGLSVQFLEDSCTAVKEWSDPETPKVRPNGLKHISSLLIQLLHKLLGDKPSGKLTEYNPRQQELTRNILRLCAPHTDEHSRWATELEALLLVSETEASESKHAGNLMAFVKSYLEKAQSDMIELEVSITGMGNKELTQPELEVLIEFENRVWLDLAKLPSEMEKKCTLDFVQERFEKIKKGLTTLARLRAMKDLQRSTSKPVLAEHVGQFLKAVRSSLKVCDSIQAFGTVEQTASLDSDAKLENHDGEMQEMVIQAQERLKVHKAEFDKLESTLHDAVRYLGESMTPKNFKLKGIVDSESKALEERALKHVQSSAKRLEKIAGGHDDGSNCLVDVDKECGLGDEKLEAARKFVLTHCRASALKTRIPECYKVID